MCAQRKASKCIPSEDDIIRSNIASFGDDIGKITNRITSMFEVASQFDKQSKEYQILDYRIKCGQKHQQDAIDRAKGIISKPMPKEWYERSAIREENFESKEAANIALRVVADRKPYFMRYIYPTLMRQYNTYIANTNKKALREFRLTIDELFEKEVTGDLSDSELEFLRYYRMKMPVGTNDCVMNRICRKFEEEFDGYIARHSSDQEFDYTIMKSGLEYSQSQYNAISKLYLAYNRRVQDYMLYVKKERIDEDTSANRRMIMVQDFKRECQMVCSNRYLLCDILLDICYQREGTKQFVWDIAGEEIIDILLQKNGGYISFPVPDANGDVLFGGESYSFVTKQIGGENNEYSAE